MQTIFLITWHVVLQPSTDEAIVMLRVCNMQVAYPTFEASSYYNSSSVYLCVCSLSPPRSFDGSSPNLVGVSRWTSHLPLRGSFSKRLTGRRVNGSLSLSTILYMRQPHATQLQKAPFALLLLQQSLIRHLLLHCISTVYVGGPRNCPWGVLFLKGQRVKRVGRVTSWRCM